MLSWQAKLAGPHHHWNKPMLKTCLKCPLGSTLRILWISEWSKWEEERVYYSCFLAWQRTKRSTHWGTGLKELIILADKPQNSFWSWLFCSNVSFSLIIITGRNAEQTLEIFSHKHDVNYLGGGELAQTVPVRHCPWRMTSVKVNSYIHTSSSVAATRSRASWHVPQQRF